MQPVEYAEDAFTQRCPTYDGVVNDDEVILIRFDALVSNIVDM